MPKPDAIILGSQSKQSDQELMRAFCKERSISLKRIVQKPGAFGLAIVDAANS
jgi:hypothetical protein